MRGRPLSCLALFSVASSLLQLMISAAAFVVPSRLFRRTLQPRAPTSTFSSVIDKAMESTKTGAWETASRTITTQVPCPENDDYNLEHLQQRTEWLIANHAALGKVCLAIAGGGGHALSTLAATSGASQVLLEGTVTYDRASFQNYLKRALPSDKSFSYSSLDAASMASESALLQGMQLRARGGGGALWALRDTIGLGSASTLKTNTQGGMSKSGKPSHGNIVATCSDGTQVGLHMTLNCPTQNRFEQDVFVSHMILQTLEEVIKMKKENGEDTAEEGDSTKREGIVDPNEFDGVTTQQWRIPSGGDQAAMDDPVKTAAHRILSGEEKAVLLLPRKDGECSNEGGRSFLQPLRYPVLPDNCLIFPGSYNPPHHGHVALATAAIAKVSPEDELRPLVFEVSIANADKPSMSPEEISRRVSQFEDVLKDAKGIPQWGILLTSAPLFSDKIEALQRYAPPPAQPHPKFPLTQKPSRWAFVIGTDTMVRVLNPKYYSNDYEQMLQAQRSMGADFVVGGRLEQSGDSTKFVTGEESLEGLPSDVKEMFVLLGESDFRVDVSSTQIRRAQQAAALPS